MDSLERGAAVAVRCLVDELIRPTPDRSDYHTSVQSAALAEALENARRTVAEMRRWRGAPQREARQAEAQVLRDLETRIAQWESVVEALGHCLAGHEWPLMPDEPPRLDLNHAQGALISDALTRAHRAFNPAPQDPETAERGAFADIPLDTSAFVAAVHLAYRLRLAWKTPRPWRFLDVGCGGGVKVALAADFFDEAVGIEVDPGYAAAARGTLEAMRAHRCAVVEADALTWDGYGGHDVIYFYRPTRDPDDLAALERRIVEQSGPDTILIAPYRGFGMRAAGLGCLQVEGPVFMKEAAGCDLPELLAEARRMGPHVFGADDDPPQGLGWLRPLWMACTLNGIRPV